MLTDTKVRAAKATRKAYKLADRDGLYLYVTPKGAKSWRYDYRIAGVRQTLTIGPYAEISLSGQLIHSHLLTSSSSSN